MQNDKEYASTRSKSFPVRHCASCLEKIQHFVLQQGKTSFKSSALATKGNAPASPNTAPVTKSDSSFCDSLFLRLFSISLSF